YGGELLNNETLSFEKGPGNKILVRLITLFNAADSSNQIAKAVRYANVDPIAMIFDIKARGAEDKTSVIDMTDFFQKDNIFSTVPGGLKKDLGLSSLAADRTFITSAKAYPINVQITTVRTYSASGGAMAMPGQ